MVYVFSVLLLVLLLTFPLSPRAPSPYYELDWLLFDELFELSPCVFITIPLKFSSGSPNSWFGFSNLLVVSSVLGVSNLQRPPKLGLEFMAPSVFGRQEISVILAYGILDVSAQGRPLDGSLGSRVLWITWCGRETGFYAYSVYIKAKEQILLIFVELLRTRSSCKKLVLPIFKYFWISKIVLSPRIINPETCR